MKRHEYALLQKEWLKDDHFREPEGAPRLCSCPPEDHPNHFNYCAGECERYNMRVCELEWPL